MKFNFGNELKYFFYKPNTREIDKGKMLAIITTAMLLIALAIYGKYRNRDRAAERLLNARYTIGLTLKRYKNIRMPNPSVKYVFKVESMDFVKFEDIPDYLKDKVNTKGGRYYVVYSSKDPNNCKLLLDYPVPDSVRNSPIDGWDQIPIPSR